MNWDTAAFRHSRLTIFAALVVGSALTPVARGEPVRAKSADAFVDSIGVNVHSHTRYEKHHAAVKTKLGELGVRHVRDGAVPAACRYAKEFFDDHGVATTFITGRRLGGKDEWKSPLDPSKIEQELDDIRKDALPATAAIEGPNEYDLFHDDREKDWTGKLRAYQRDLHSKVKADPQLKSIPVIAPSLTSEGAYKSVGDLDAWIDFSCLHFYQSSRHPGTAGWGPNGYGSISWGFERLAKRQSPLGKPIQSTENGYKTTGGGDPVTEPVDAAYTPRMFAEFYRRGIVRSFKYELLGDEWGLLRDDLSERPAFTALKNLIAVVRDPGPSFAPGELDYSVSDLANTRHVLLQHRDGSYRLLLWREIPVFDPAAKKELVVKDVDATLTLKNRVRRVEVYDPSKSVKPVASNPDTDRVTVPLGGNLLVIAVKPA